VIEAIPASNDVNLPGLATTETLTRHVNLNYFSEAVSWEGEERLADADSWRITDNSDVTRLGSSGWAPLLAPSPLRTGLEGFPFIRLEHPKTPP